MLRCGNCNGGVTAEEHYNRHGYHYLYYGCQAIPGENARYVQEEPRQSDPVAMLDRLLHQQHCENFWCCFVASVDPFRVVVCRHVLVLLVLFVFLGSLGL